MIVELGFDQKKEKDAPKGPREGAQIFMLLEIEKVEKLNFHLAPPQSSKWKFREQISLNLMRNLES